MALRPLVPSPACQPRRFQGRVCTAATEPSASFPMKPWTQTLSGIHFPCAHFPSRFQSLPFLFAPSWASSSARPGVVLTGWTYRRRLGLLAPVECTITPLGLMVVPVL